MMGIMKYLFQAVQGVYMFATGRVKHARYTRNTSDLEVPRNTCTVWDINSIFHSPQDINCVSMGMVSCNTITVYDSKLVIRGLNSLTSG